jgi:hypothetical protein
MNEQIDSLSARVGVHNRVAYMRGWRTDLKYACSPEPCGTYQRHHTDGIGGIKVHLTGMLECGQSTLHRVSPVESVDWSRGPKWSLLLKLAKCAEDLEKYQNKVD